jgi:hypothetical protein
MNLEKTMILLKSLRRLCNMQMLFIKVFAILGTVCYALYYSKQILGV